MLFVGALCAVICVVVAYLRDRNSRDTRKKILSSPVERSILDDIEAPAYILAEDVRTSTTRTALSEQHRESISSSLNETTPLSSGWASSDFVTDMDKGWAVLDSPIIVVTESITRIDDIIPIIAITQRKGTGLVLVAESIAPEVLSTLCLNSLSGRLSCVCILTKDLDLFAQYSHSTVISSADLTSGYIPGDYIGSCDLWVSDKTRTWIITDDHPG